MTIHEAQQAGVVAVRKPYWNASARLDLPPRVVNGFGPWTVLHDQGTKTNILLWDADDGKDDWEPV